MPSLKGEDSILAILLMQQPLVIKNYNSMVTMVKWYTSYMDSMPNLGKTFILILIAVIGIVITTTLIINNFSAYAEKGEVANHIAPQVNSHHSDKGPTNY